MKEKVLEFKTDEDTYTLSLDKLVVGKSSLVSKLPFGAKDTTIDYSEIKDINLDEEDSTITKLTIIKKDNKSHVFQLKPEKVEDSKVLREQVRLVYLYVKHRLK